eukprot:1735248-Amphidinium_carterae.1
MELYYKKTNQKTLSPNDHYSVLVAGPPRLASTSKSTITTAMSTVTNGIYMLSLPRQQTHKRDPPGFLKETTRRILLQGHQQHWAWEIQIYINLDCHHLQDLLANVKIQQLLTHDDAKQTGKKRQNDKSSPMNTNVTTDSQYQKHCPKKDDEIKEKSFQKRRNCLRLQNYQTTTSHSATARTTHSVKLVPFNIMVGFHAPSVVDFATVKLRENNFGVGFSLAFLC